MNKKDQHKDSYLREQCIDCPFCGVERPAHSCGNCYLDMTQEDCWQWEGYCSKKCLKYIREELPKHRQEKIDAGIVCQCVDSQCAKCLSINCLDDNCPTHPAEKKLAFRVRCKN